MSVHSNGMECAGEVASENHRRDWNSESSVGVNAYLVNADKDIDGNVDVDIDDNFDVDRYSNEDEDCKPLV